MKKPKALKTPYGDMPYTDKDTNGVHGAQDFQTCMLCRKPNTSWFSKDLFDSKQYQWAISQSLPCHLCRPDLYVWEDEPKQDGFYVLPFVSCFFCKKTVRPHEQCSVEVGNECTGIACSECAVTKQGVSEPTESKPLRFVGHLAGCSQADKRIDYQYCSCWRAICYDGTDPYMHNGSTRGGADYKHQTLQTKQIVGLPYTKLRSDWD